MNKRLLLKILGELMIVEALIMVPSLAVALYFGDGDAMGFVNTIAILVVLGVPLWKLPQPAAKDLGPREGFAVVGMAWIVLSVFGAMPLMFSGMIPNFVDAFFETVSGFTTTGASIMNQMEAQPRGAMFWRSFTHWIGGMGVLVLTLALVPRMTGRTSHLLRAESPGPTLSKLVPKLGDSAKILYLIYGVLTLVEAGCLMLAGLNLYDALIHAFGTAGTGGFSNYTASVGHFDSALIDGIITVFMLLFGINFALFYRVLMGDWRGALKSEELRWYLGTALAAMLFITLAIVPQYGSFFTALRYSSFQTASIMSTTGFVTQDFDRWPQAVKMLIVMLMFMGSCAGSTAGGMKVVRVTTLLKVAGREIRRTFQPRRLQMVRYEGKTVEDSLASSICVFAFTYVALILVGAFVISLENRFDFTTNLSAAITCVSNVGPGLGAVGPTGNFAGYGPLGKLTCSFLMLAGRLELFPMLVLFHPAAWKSHG